jgi:glycosyltransferase involved in cell wall biosynthesis
MKVLILCDLFPPAFGPRMGYLCKYLRQEGIETTVVTEYVPDDTFAFLADGTDVVRLPCFRSDGRRSRQHAGPAGALLNMLLDRKNRLMYREALRQTRAKGFDLILCSTYRLFPLPAACRLAAKTRLPLLVDLRDIIEQYAGHEFIARPLPQIPGLTRLVAAIFGKASLLRRNRALRRAAAVTTVSPWHVETLRRHAPHVSLIYNGFDPDLFAPADVVAKRFYITYTGRIGSIAMRDPALLLEAVARMAGEGLVSPDTFRIRWFTDEPSQRLLRRETEKYALADFMDYHDCVPAVDIPAILHESAIILLLTNKSAGGGPKGVMTTKFFEALAVQRPVLCVRSDEGSLEETLLRTRAGLPARNAGEARRFIEHHYRRWLDTGRTTVDVDRREVDTFSRRTQARQFIRIFEQITRPHNG